MKQRIIIALVVLVAMTACSQLKSLYQLKNCEYSYNSISGIKVADIDCSSTSSVLQASNLLKIAKLIATNFKELPIELTVNINVKNPGTQTAAICYMDYDIAIDDIDVASGDIQKAFSVEGGKTAVLPLSIKTDLGNVIDSENRSKVVAIVKNFAGISGEASTIKLQLRPTVQLSKNVKTQLPSIPVSFTYSGKKKS